MFKALWKRVQRWYEGEMKFDSAPMPGPYFERHWTAEKVRTLVNFYLKYWMWIWGIVVAIVLDIL